MSVGVEDALGGVVDGNRPGSVLGWWSVMAVWDGGRGTRQVKSISTQNVIS